MVTLTGAGAAVFLAGAAFLPLATVAFLAGVFLLMFFFVMLGSPVDAPDGLRSRP
jgi:hypothetical protein